MAASVAKLQLSLHALEFSRADRRRRIQLKLHRNQASFSRCRASRSEEGESESARLETFDGKKEKKGLVEVKRKGPLYSLKSLLVKAMGRSRVQIEGEYKKTVEKAEEIFFLVSCFYSFIF